MGCPLEVEFRGVIVGWWFFGSELFCYLVGKLVSRYVCISNDPLDSNCRSEYMEIIGDIGEYQGSKLSRAEFEGIEMFYGSLIFCEN
jgi:hypothetical protein